MPTDGGTISGSGPQAPYHRCRCRQRPADGGTHRHPAPSGKPDPGPQAGVATAVALVNSAGVLPVSYFVFGRRRQP
jgi:hypothetical protein